MDCGSIVLEWFIAREVAKYLGKSWHEGLHMRPVHDIGKVARYS